MLDVGSPPQGADPDETEARGMIEADPGSGPPTVSVCIPTLGRASLYSRAIPSALAEEGDLAEVVIAFHGDDVLIDQGALDHPRITAVRHTGPTVGGVRNAAAAVATGEVLVFLDDDDSLAPGALGRLREMLTDPRQVFASGAVEVYRDGALERVTAPEPLGGLYHGLTANFLAGSFAVRRSVFEEVGGYSQSLAFGENYDLGVRIARLIHDDRLCYSWTDAVIVRVTPSGSNYQDEQAVTAAFTLDNYAGLLAAHPQERATLHAILGVYHWRQRDRARSRSHLRRALADWPRDPRHALRLALTTVPWLADRRWRP